MNEVIIVDNGNRYKCVKEEDSSRWVVNFKLRNGCEGEFKTPLKWAKTALSQACFQISEGI